MMRRSMAAAAAERRSRESRDIRDRPRRAARHDHPVHEYEPACNLRSGRA